MWKVTSAVVVFGSSHRCVDGENLRGLYWRRREALVWSSEEAVASLVTHLPNGAELDPAIVLLGHGRWLVIHLGSGLA